MTVPVAGAGTVTARVTAADQDGVVLAHGDSGAEQRWPYSALGPGAVHVEFGRPSAGDGDGDGDGEGDDGDAEDDATNGDVTADVIAEATAPATARPAVGS